MSKVLTVSIAAYNMESYIRQTLNSLIVPEILEKIEVLVVDDGGTDGTLAIAKEYETKYPITFHAIHKENGGYGSVINKSIELATGKYFKQLDGDDWFETETLLAYVKMLEQSDADIVLTQTIEYHEDSSTSQIKDVCAQEEEGSHLFTDASFNHFISMHSATIKTDILKNMKRRITEHCFYTDIELVYCPLSMFNSYYVWHKPVYIYRLGREGQSMSVSGIRKYYKDHERVFWKLVAIYKEIPNYEIAKKDLMLMRICKEIAAHFKYCCMMESKNMGYNEVTTFGYKLKRDFPEALQAAKKYSKFVRLMLMTNYKIYPILAYREMHRGKI